MGKTRSQVAKQAKPGSAHLSVQARLAALSALVAQKDYAGVEAAARDLLKSLRAHSYVLKALSFGLLGQGKFELSLPVLEEAIRLNARDPELQNNMGISLAATLRWDEALTCFDRALALQDRDAEIWKNKGVVLGNMNRWGEAVGCFVKAVEVYPGDYDEAIDRLAAALTNAGRNDEAFACFSELLASNPEKPVYHGGWIRAALPICHWEGMVARVANLRYTSAQFEQLAIAPLEALAVPGITPLELRRIAEANVRDKISADVISGPWLAPRQLRGTPEKRPIRVGYLSYDMRSHAVGYVIPQVLELHDRSCVEVFAYSMGPDDKSEIRQRLIKACDHFVDISAYGAATSARKIRDDGIDILVDLQGWTIGARAAILALRPAPVQVSWVGYAGTLGSPRLVDYLIGDSIVTPLGAESLYSERIVRLPHCYLPMDASRSVGAPPGRAEAGLPESAFVFCSFNNSVKLNPEVFDAWCRILLETPGSCLWLSRPPGTGAESLLREAESRGVSGNRIFFAGFVDSRAEHLARLQLADLALDPAPYTSHSSGMDALWAGVPMVTLLGTTFAGRVGASLLTAAGLPECITNSWDEYVRLCVSLWRQPDRLRQIRTRLAADRGRVPLFDMKGLTDGLESLYSRMYSGDLRITSDFG